MKFINLLLAIILCGTSLHAQTNKDLQRASLYFAKGEYHGCIKYTELCNIPLGELTCHSLYKYARSCQLLGLYKKSENSYKNYIGRCNNEKKVLFYFGQVLMNNEKYEIAKKVFRLYAHQHPEDSIAYSMIAGCDSSLIWLDEISSQQVSNITSLNTEEDEITPIPYKNDLVYSSNMDRITISKKNDVTGKGNFNLYISSFKNKWKKPKSFSSRLNTEEDETAVCFNNNYTKAYFTRVNPYESDSAIHALKMYKSELSDEKWQTELSFIYDIDSVSFGHPSISPNGRMLFFVSDMPGGYGGTDIYVCKKEGNKWGKPKNLGPEINTTLDEIYPFYLGSGKLYFSSNGHIGLGGFDLYESQKVENVWGNVKNLHFPINSSKNDISISFNKSTGTAFFSSNRYVDKGYDLFEIRDK